MERCHSQLGPIYYTSIIVQFSIYLTRYVAIEQERYYNLFFVL